MERLFNEGDYVMSHPLKIIYLKAPINRKFLAQAMFVVPKRNFKKAHDRNQLKRRMREAYRLEKKVLYEILEKKEKKIIVAFLFVGKQREEYAVIKNAMSNSLKKIAQRV